MIYACYLNVAGLSPWQENYGLEPSGDQRRSSASPSPMSPLTWTLPQIQERGDHSGLSRLSFTLSATMGWQGLVGSNYCCGSQSPVCYRYTKTPCAGQSIPAHNPNFYDHMNTVL